MKHFFSLILALLFANITLAQDTISASATSFCIGSEITFNTSLGKQYDTFAWDLGDGNTTSQREVKHIYETAGTYNVKLTASIAGTSELTSLYSVTIYDLPKVGFKVDSTTQISVKEFTDTITPLFPPLNYEWDFGDGSTSNAKTPDVSVTHAYSAPGNYNVALTITDNNGCIDTATTNVTIGASTIVPNVFTPNGDGQNDYFMISANGAKLTLEIFNRWGYKMFSCTGTENIVWDGYNPQGTLVSPGTYFYTITVVEGTTNYNPLNGYITVFY